MTANEAAAVWWSERLLTAAKATKFHDHLLSTLNQLKRDWHLAVDRPEGLLGKVISQTFEGQEAPSFGSLFEEHFAMEYREEMLWIREGAGKPWRTLHW